MSDLQKLREKLCRELSQSEHSAVVHPRREAKRLGNTPPADAFRAIADHAERMRPRFEKLVKGDRASAPGVVLARLVGELFSVMRHGLFDRLIDRERSYRGTLLGADHGADLVRLLQAVAERENDPAMKHFCEDWLAGRLPLIARAQTALAWFASEPAFARATP